MKIKTLIHTGLLASSIIARAATPATPHATETPLLSAGPHANESKEERDARMAWWREARFGMFIHWGVYASLGGIYKGKQINGLGEQIMAQGQIPIANYKALARQFNPTQYEPEQWVLLAKRAGMKYIIITAKHIDGFALWPSAVNDWNVGCTLYKKDLLKPLAEACRKHGIKLGFYYSQIVDHSNGGTCNNWDPANKRDTDDYIASLAVPQIRELMSNYGEFPAVMWWDVPVGMNRERASKILEVLKLKPGVIQNNRLYKMAGHMGVIDMKNLEANKRDPYFGDTETPEQYVPATGLGERDFEVCMTMNDTWGYKSYDHNWKSTRVLLQQLIDIASKGGNYLLNVGPTGEGLIPQASVERLEEIGRWMAANSESIYGTTASPFKKLLWGRATKRPGKLYLHVFDWPADGKLLVPGLKSKIRNAYLLADAGKAKLPVTEDGESKIITVGEKAPVPVVSVVVLEIEGDLEVVHVLIKPAADGSIALPARLVDLGQPDRGGSARLETEKDSVFIGYWLNSAAWVSWQFTGAKPGTYEVVADIAGPDDSKATLEIGKEKLPVTFAKTGGYRTFQPQVLGQIKITGNGDQQLSIRPDKEGWKAINIKQVALRDLAVVAEQKPSDPAPISIETKDQRDARMAWWREARFGMFIHWGVFSVPAGVYKGETFPGPSEYLMRNAKIPAAEYREFAKGFTASNYDADAIVRLAKQAGMKYIVITAKHHDGFAMFPSAASDWNITQTPYGKDILKPLAEACRKHGIKLGFYYSQAVDWINGGAGTLASDGTNPDIDKYINEVAVPQVRELLTNYGEFPAVIWWDTPSAMNEQRAAKLLELLKLKPGVIHNNRLLKMAGHMGVIDMQNLAANKRNPFFGDTETPEQHIPATGLGDRDFEVCMTMNDIWGYKRDDHNWKSTKVLLHHLIDIASKGGNYLLNIGPMADGTIPEPSVERLKAIGDWMKVNGESIYGTTASPFTKLPWGRCTTRKHKDGTTLYLQVFDWPANGKLDVRGLISPVKSARLLASGVALTFAKTAEGWVVDVPDKALDPNATVIQLEIEGELKTEFVPMIKAADDGTITFPAAEAEQNSEHGPGTRLLAGKDSSKCIAYWTNPGAWVAWDFATDKPGAYEVVAEVGSPDDSKATIEIAGEKLAATFVKTGNYEHFKPEVVGTIQIKAKGSQQLAIRPDKEGWKAVNLKRVVLRPVATP